MDRAILKGVVLQNDPLSIFTDANAYFLVFAGCILQPCVANGYILGLALNIDPDS
jgi:hypothetical protein